MSRLRKQKAPAQGRGRQGGCRQGSGTLPHPVQEGDIGVKNSGINTANRNFYDILVVEIFLMKNGKFLLRKSSDHKPFLDSKYKELIFNKKDYL
ncbi:hypothetical protein LH427_04935 [Laribacter hongkongensis]|nr:hypothetical protein [Laribacter hongkongensis]MCG8991491.1 hypothetical protein [Laribacter hongkongensis]MCG8994416.1 hypothetical protein [Laribacter hongkongensis]MCG9001227.1 hypothetical protein [Laribacter hongkongensis]MCG9003077.1 hypothetical protein [Laribacter hongkongensis]MCG9007435.1 hypothetical protein [Laribacter hongkongensis]